MSRAFDRFTGRWCRAILFGSLLGAVPALGAPVIDIGTLEGGETQVVEMSDEGEIIGISRMLDGNWHGFLWSRGTMLDLGTLGGTETRPAAINASGQVVGYSTNAAGDERAFLYDNGVMTDLGTFGGATSFATDINDSGQIVGRAALPGDAASHAFLYEDGTLIDLGTLGGTWSRANAINASGQVVGAAALAGDTPSHAFLYSGAGLVDLGAFDGPNSEAQGINNAGQVIGEADRLFPEGFSLPDAFLYSGGVLSDLTPESDFSTTTEINSSGTVLGYAYGVDLGCQYFCQGDGSFLHQGGVTEYQFSQGTLSFTLTAIGESDRVAKAYGDGAYIEGTGFWQHLIDVARVLDLNASDQASGNFSVLDPDSNEIDHAFFTPCPYRPRTDCIEAEYSRLLIARGNERKKDRLNWSWSTKNSPETIDLGEPGSTGYMLCIYDADEGVSRLADSLYVGPNHLWHTNPPGSAKYRDAEGAQSGVTWIVVKAEPGASSRLKVRAKGAGAMLLRGHDYPAFYSLDPSLTVQVHQDDGPTCWTSEFTTAEDNDSWDRFEARTPP